MDQTREIAERIVHRYQKELKNIRRMRWMTLIVYLLLLWMMSSKMGINMAAISVILLLVALKMLSSMYKQQFALLQQVLNKKCDAVVYTEIMNLLAENPGKEANTIQICIAKGLYYSGRFQEAREALNSFYEERPTVGTAMLYHSQAFDCALALDDLDTARNELQEARQLLRGVPPKKAGGLQKQVMVMEAALALQEKRYEDFFPLQAQVLAEAITPLQKVTALYRQAVGELESGEDAAAEEHLKQVAEEGGTLFMADEAKEFFKD